MVIQREMMMRLLWARTFQNTWPAFGTLQMPPVDSVHGVYIIWWGNKSPYVLDVGSGDVGRRLRVHAADVRFMEFLQNGIQLSCSWAEIGPPNHHRAERYLANLLKPEFGERFPDVEPLRVNLPWDTD